MHSVFVIINPNPENQIELLVTFFKDHENLSPERHDMLQVRRLAVDGNHLHGGQLFF